MRSVLVTNGEIDYAVEVACIRLFLTLNLRLGSAECKSGTFTVHGLPAVSLWEKSCW
jgi:hypothetical protein